MIKSKFTATGQPNIRLTNKKDTLVSVLPNGLKQIEIGIGAREEMTRRRLIVLIRQIISTAKIHGVKKISLSFSDFRFAHLGTSENDLAELMGVNFEMANFQFVKYKTPPPEGWIFVEKIEIAGASAPAKKAFKQGQIIGDGVNYCRTLANTPGGEMTPRKLAQAARAALRGARVKVKILGKREMARLRMGGILGVSRGSDEKPQFIIMEYWGAGRRRQSASSRHPSAPVVLVGKGVTFDTGGLNVKPENYMYEMHMDMSGGAAVLSAIALAAKLNIKKNIVGLIPAVENMPSGSSYHPGDVLKTYSGKTIEILNTDAEGRVILADALGYALRYNPRLVVDVATLTGAAMGALGQRASAIFTKDEKMEKLFRELGEESGDYVWPFPLWDEFEDEIKGTFGDWANMGKTRYGGAITGAIFLHQFVKDKKGDTVPWVHIDMAPRMTAVEGEHLAKGAAGAPVRLLIKLLERF
ncbi:leucyl aminopeptidase family protein [Candidatus Wolfebacteria bacterium]|nr:leucyl aminopeptidase family protein [Candidatus Wolfebacteria bacterium]